MFNVTVLTTCVYICICQLLVNSKVAPNVHVEIFMPKIANMKLWNLAKAYGKNLYVHGYHTKKNIWESVDGEMPSCFTGHHVAVGIVRATLFLHN